MQRFARSVGSCENLRTVKTRLLILSDTHSLKPFPNDDTQHAYRSPLPEADVLLHAGDLTMSGRKVEHQSQIEMLVQHPAELKIVVPGNHDITLDEPYYATHLWKHDPPEDVAEIQEMYDGPEARDAGIVLMKEGIKSFSLKNGAEFSIYASAYQPDFFDWAFAYKRNEDRFNLPSLFRKMSARAPDNPVPNHPQIDIMITHGPPRGILDVVGSEARRMKSSVGCQHLLRAVQRCKPRVHAFGHIHEGWGARLKRWQLEPKDATAKDESLTTIEIDREDVLARRGAYLDISDSGKTPLQWGEETLFINASIMTVRYRPQNAPWVVDLELPLKPEA